MPEGDSGSRVGQPLGAAGSGPSDRRTL